MCVAHRRAYGHLKAISEGRLDGTRISFSVAGERYTGEVRGARMRGEVDGSRPWRAKRQGD
jgi:hypothetical protein